MVLQGNTIKFATESTALGITIDNKLNFRAQFRKFKKSRKGHRSFGTFCTESIHHAFHHFETYELRGDPRVDIPESGGCK